ncbi:alpha-1,6-mannosyl-glycoprotein beta-1,2-N-acetylglucosaminyltransferase [Apostasia shenzhenica]|uniref:Alpha-1,6-mannosyl-glycoprotein 2-beta-N-acetylglucosaminyltransferase n=1 Tax=Apostasia shenzhenica TaxID=1088818 RepID=A0A2I0ANC6_9ASPA|nr:alpha-1,6-mannosyl-glycoprotein beta-1,2-N-acetylglucosaminyltransferase [Apostasia shenzhenica]
MAFHKRSRFKDVGFRRLLPLALIILSVALALFLLIITGAVSRASVNFPYQESEKEGPSSSMLEMTDHILLNMEEFNPKLPKLNDFAISLEQRNRLPPRNINLFPNLAENHVKIVLYVHNRPQYLQVVIKSLAEVEGIGETMLIVSHDGYFSEMDEIVQGIRFCQVKQIFSPYSPHLYSDRFPGVSKGDCLEKEDPSVQNCNGNADQYGNYRSPRIVSLKHHWWWMMNTVWDGLPELRRHSGHMLFIEEDHFIYPNAYRNLQLLTALKPMKCPDCFAVNLAPSDVKSKGEGWEKLIAEKIGNVGYAFNRTVWRKIHAKAKEFCWFDDYNWDITMWATVYPSFRTPVFTLRGPRTSATHFGKCGLHQGQDKIKGCIDNGEAKFELDKIDTVPNINMDWPVFVFKKQHGYQPGFRGWGGWGDQRDRELCLSFAYIYHSPQASTDKKYVSKHP